MIRRAIALFMPVLLGLAACGPATENGNDVTVIGRTLQAADPAMLSPDPAQSVILGATAQGLVRFDGNGQVQPALASRWAIVDQGRSLIFRLSEGDEGEGRPAWLTAEAIAQRLRAALIANPRNRLSPHFNAVDSIRAVTPLVIEIRLKTARPELLQLLAQPDAAILFNGMGTGPFRIHNRLKTGWRLDRVDLRGRAIRNDDGGATAGVTIRAEAANRAVARFRLGKTKLVLGGQYQDLPLVQHAGIPAGQIRFDPANGLFGIAFRGDHPFIAEQALRQALAMSIDRRALLRAMRMPTEMVQEVVLPLRLADAPVLPRPGWLQLSMAERTAFAQTQVARWTQGNSQPLLRLLLPKGHGSTLLLAYLRAQWGGVGVRIDPADGLADADLVLIDAVAPADTASWYLRQFMCDGIVRCDRFADRKLTEARDAADAPARATALQEAAESMNTATLFVPLARPIRWSLVNPAMLGFADNARAVHPLLSLRDKPSR
jgi:peptide/nickel transport system substrate-binding protein